MKDVQEVFTVAGVALLVFFVLVHSIFVYADEALVEVKSGKVIAVKPNGSVWGRMETDGKHYCVKKIEDKSLTYDPGTPLKVYPYAVYSNQIEVTKGETNITPRLVTESAYKVDPKADDSKTPLVKDSASFTNTTKSVATVDPKEEPIEKPGEVVK